MNRALRAATVGVLLFSPVALSACSAGQVTQTGTQERDKTGSLAQVGDITIRSARLVYPDGGRYEPGDDAELAMAIVNSSTEPDTLLDVTGEGFGDAEITAASTAATATPSGASASSSASASPSTAASPSAPAAPGATTPAAPTTSTPATGSASGSSRLEIPANSSVFVGPSGGYTITLTDLQESLTTGQYLEMTLTFEKAGDVRLVVTVDNPPRTEKRGENFNFHEETNE